MTNEGNFKNRKGLIVTDEQALAAFGRAGLDGSGLYIRSDCSGFVGACLQLMNIIQRGRSVSSATMLSIRNNMENSGMFRLENWNRNLEPTNANGAVPGDIFFYSPAESGHRSGHITIYASDGKYYDFGNDRKTVSVSRPIMKGYCHVYRCVKNARPWLVLCQRVMTAFLDPAVFGGLYSNNIATTLGKGQNNYQSQNQQLYASTTVPNQQQGTTTTQQDPKFQEYLAKMNQNRTNKLKKAVTDYEQGNYNDALNQDTIDYYKRQLAENRLKSVIKEHINRYLSNKR